MEGNLFSKTSALLYDTFFVDDKKFGEQQLDGSYKYVKRKLSPVTIENMLENGGSMLTYQELHISGTAFIKWICIDLDISKNEIDENSVNSDNLKKVKKTADAVSAFLFSQDIPHLVEFSGRRGFHIWVIFERLISKEEGYYFISYIYSNIRSQFEEGISADLFPKTPFVNKNSKGVGFGVKLPLSQNKASGKLSFFIDKETFFEYDQEKWSEKATNEILEKQYQILHDYIPVSVEKIKPFIDESIKNSPSHIPTHRKKLEISISSKIKLDDILKSLKKCNHLEKILKNYEKGLGGKERGILVGLLGNIGSEDDSDFGKKILLELFSNVVEYNEDITLKKIEELKYYKPITCKALGCCRACENTKITSPIELIEGINLKVIPTIGITNINSEVFNKIKNSLLNYSLKNDEVPLFPQIERLKVIEFEEIEKGINDVFQLRLIPLETYKFQRNEIHKVRDLHNIDAYNNFISTYFIFLINTLFYSEISSNSFGYEFSGSFYGDNIFHNWFINWGKFTRKIEDVLYGKEYDDYYVLKLDIKNFYDRIDLKRLRIKLFEEAPPNIKNRFSELEEEEISRYKSIVDYLIKLSGDTTKNYEKGLPQGPAYARYLAELYLLGLDDLIENKFIKDQKREFYYRFVDDVFVFAESEERAFELFDSLKKWLSINGLEYNQDKTKIINVKEYRESGEYHKFKDDVKYDINRANKNKNILSEAEIRDAIYKLEEITEDIKFGLKDNLRFFYSQFKDNARLNKLREKLADILPFSNDGRGTLYMMFYTNLILNFPEKFWSLSTKLKNITGLSLTHYLNTVLFNEEEYLKHTEEIKIIIDHLASRNDLTEADQLLVTILSFKTNTPLPHNYDQKIMHSALQLPNLELTINHWTLTKERLENLKNSDLIDELKQIILNQNYTREFLNTISNYAFLRFSEWSTKEEGFLKDETVLKNYYQVITFLTLFYDSDFQNVNATWELLLETSKNIGEFQNKNHKFYWIDKIEKFEYSDFSSSSYSLILSNKPGSSLGTINCRNEFLEQYRTLLIILLFEKDKANNLEHFNKEVLSEVTTDSLFYNWVSDSTSELYPESPDLSLKNIALNGLIVLKNGSKFFVKNIYGKSIETKYNYLKVTSQADTAEIEYTLSTENLKTTLDQPNFIEFIKKLNEIVQSHTNFSKTYKSNPPYFYSPFESVESLPVVPFYSDYEIITNFQGSEVKLDVGAYWASILELLKYKKINEIKLNNSVSKFNFGVSDIDERFFPVSPLFGNSETSKIDFISQFSENINGDITSIFQYQYIWDSTVFRIAEKLKNSNPTIINFLKIHFDTYTDTNLELDILFSVDYRLQLKNSTLEEFFDTIKYSVNIFQNHITKNEFDFLKMLEGYIPKLDKPLNEFLKKSVIVTDISDRILNKTIYTIRIDEIEVPDNKPVFLYNHYTSEFEKIDLSDLQIKIRNEIIFAYQSEDSVCIYLPDPEITKCYERVSKRKELYDKIDAYSSTPEQIEGFKDLFPIKHDFSKIEKTIDGFADFDSIETKLNTHLSNSDRIKDKVIYWLAVFNEESIGGSNLKKYMDENNYSFEYLYKTILSVVQAHSFISEEHINCFINKIDGYHKDENSILFSIKNPLADANGLKRLLSRGKIQDRKINWQNNFNRLCTEEGLKNLVIISDIGISGSQTIKALGNYYLITGYQNDTELIAFNKDARPRQKSPIDERYFTFDKLDSCKKFNENFGKFKKIIFLSAYMTTKFKDAITAFLEDVNPNVKFDFCGDLVENYTFEQARINKEQRALFEILIKDNNLISKLFRAEEDKYYNKNVENLNDLNLILRVESLPAKHIKLFSLEPRRGGPSLFEYVKNWK